MKDFNIIGVGDADIDIMLRVDRIPHHDEKQPAQLLGRFPGGMIANFCSAAATFGVKTGIITTVGDDDFGQMTVEDLRRRGVDDSRIIVKPGEDTYFSIAQLDGSGEKALTVCLTSTTMPENEDVDLDYVSKADYVHLMGSHERLSLYVGAYAWEHGVKVSYDIEHGVSAHSLEVRRQMARYAHIMFPNEMGLRAFTGCTSIEDGAEMMLKMGTHIVVVTRGAQGADVFTREEHFHQDTLNVDVQDTTGAGDCFNGVFLACLSKGYSLRKCAKLATGAAVMAICKVGSRTGYSSEPAIVAFLAENGIIL